MLNSELAIFDLPFFGMTYTSHDDWIEHAARQTGEGDGSNDSPAVAGKASRAASVSKVSQISNVSIKQVHCHE
jgi:hypothetical protein